MANKAAAALASLASMGGNIAQLEDGNTALNRLEPDQNIRGATPVQDDDKGEAKFGTAEAIATTVLSSLILGPVGGLLLGGAQGWLKKQADQTILDQIATEQNVLTDAAATYDDVLQQAKDSATSEEDLAQIAVLEAQRSASIDLMTSGDVALRDQGLEAFAKFEAGLQAYSTLQETQQIAEDAEQTRLGVELTARQLSSYNKSIDSFRSESSLFEATMQSTNQALIALESGSPADIWASSILMNKALDPESVSRESESAAVQAQGTRIEKWQARANKELSTGSGMSAETRRLYKNLVRDIQANVTGFQLAREARFMDEAIDNELPDHYLDNFRLASTLPNIETFHIPDDEPTTVDTVAAKVESVIDAAANPKETARNMLDDMRLGVTDTMEELADWYSGSGRTKRAARRNRLPTN